jgi:hypothetical protein
LIIIEWSSHDVYEDRVSLLPYDGANCDRWEFANWRKLQQMVGFIKYGQEFPHKGTVEYVIPMANTGPKGGSNHQLLGMFKKVRPARPQYCLLRPVGRARC